MYLNTANGGLHVNSCLYWLQPNCTISSITDPFTLILIFSEYCCLPCIHVFQHVFHGYMSGWLLLHTYFQHFWTIWSILYTNCYSHCVLSSPYILDHPYPSPSPSCAWVVSRELLSRGPPARPVQWQLQELHTTGDEQVTNEHSHGATATRGLYDHRYYRLRKRVCKYGMM